MGDCQSKNNVSDVSESTKEPSEKTVTEQQVQEPVNESITEFAKEPIGGPVKEQAESSLELIKVDEIEQMKRINDHATQLSVKHSENEDRINQVAVSAEEILLKQKPFNASFVGTNFCNRRFRTF